MSRACSTRNGSAPSDGLFILSGVVNRIDRRDFDPAHCGELRFIYRLGYEVRMNGKTYASRMPFTVNMVFSYADDGRKCQDIASLWRIEGIDSDDPAAIAQRLLQGPLDFSRLIFKQMEINAQVVRFPSDLENMENRKFAGQAIYWMRIFALQGWKISADQTGKYARRAGDPEGPRQAETIAGVPIKPHRRDRQWRIQDAGEPASRYRAELFHRRQRARGQSPVRSRGRQGAGGSSSSRRRRAAKPPKFVQSGAGLLERLNTSSCMGCHQSSSTAGFHFLGVDRFDLGRDADAVKAALDGNTLQLPFSPHVYAELVRRKDYVERVSRGQAPNIFARIRPRPRRAGRTRIRPTPPPVTTCLARSNADLAGTAKWSCNAARHLSCQPVVTNASASSHLGQCVPAAQNISCGPELPHECHRRLDREGQCARNG